MSHPHRILDPWMGLGQRLQILFRFDCGKVEQLHSTGIRNIQVLANQAQRLNLADGFGRHALMTSQIPIRNTSFDFTLKVGKNPDNYVWLLAIGILSDVTVPKLLC